MPYDSQWLIALSRQVYPDLPELAIALSECTQIISPKNTIIDTEKDFYIRFRPFAGLGQSKCIVMESDSYTIVLDVILIDSSFNVIAVEKLNHFLYSQCSKVIEIKN